MSRGASLCSAAAALALANARYWTAVAPQARSELRAWACRAEQIEDPVLRRHALAKLRSEHFNAEVAATLATLARPRERAHVVSATVAFQVLYDYLDALGEQPVEDPIANGRQLAGVFATALSPDAHDAARDYYHHHPQEADGGYLDALANRCQAAFAALPAAAVVAPFALEAASRCGEAQARTHAVRRHGCEQLAAWACGEADDDELSWWEVAAGAVASVLTVHALIAAAADARTTPQEADGIAAAYLPISALTTLLDSLVDRDRDLATDSHGYVAYYADAELIAERIALVARRGMAAAGSLRHAAHHAMTVTGVAAYYLSAPGAESAFARPIAARVVTELQPLIGPILAIFRIWRWVKRLRLPGRSLRLTDGAQSTDMIAR